MDGGREGGQMRGQATDHVITELALLADSVSKKLCPCVLCPFVPSRKTRFPVDWDKMARFTKKW